MHSVSEKDFISQDTMRLDARILYGFDTKRRQWGYQA
jgi:hypothetical protein